MGIKPEGVTEMETRPTTISKVIAFELGLLIAVLTWIAFAGIPGIKHRMVAEAEAPEPTDTSFANVSPIYQPTQPRSAPVNYPSDDVQVAQTSTPNPVATVQTYDPGLTAGAYDDTVDGRGQLSYGYDQPGVEGYYFNPDPADSIGIYPEPVLDSPYCYYSPYGYSQPVQVVILNNNRTFAPRHRMDHRGPRDGMRNAPRRNPPGAPRMQGDRRRTRPGPVASGRSVPPRSHVNPGNRSSGPRRNAPVRTARSGQASQARWNP
jgi:hypothetical protein